jgi:N-methylhydantoinase A
MGKLISIDNGGTLTDFCAIEGAKLWRTKTLTTPHDLSQCVFDGLTRLSMEVYGKEDLARLLLESEHLRYSTTQGTNALVMRKGPRLGLLCDAAGMSQIKALKGHEKQAITDLVGDRHEQLPSELDENFDTALTGLVNRLASQGASRLIVALSDDYARQHEASIRSILIKRFPSHLLGAIPILYANDMEQGDQGGGAYQRRLFTALFNAYLHPAMERFLYAADHKFRLQKSPQPLLIFRNDGYSARVAKTTAIRTYSSGPRGGMEAARALARHHGIGRMLTMDVGGTTTDIGLVENGAIRQRRFGEVDGVQVSFPMSDVTSVGVGGSSVHRVVNGQIEVGPLSVGSAPGPACFGFGGDEATITDALLVLGLLDPASYCGGTLRIRLDRAQDVIRQRVADPLKLTLEQAALAMKEAWVKKVAVALREYTEITPDTVLAAFGGAGPLLSCQVAQAAGISRILVPGLAAVLSAYGIGFSDIAHVQSRVVRDRSVTTLQTEAANALLQLQRDMKAEGFDLAECELSAWFVLPDGNESPAVSWSHAQGLPALAWPQRVEAAALTLKIKAVRVLPHAALSKVEASRQEEARLAALRTVYDGKSGAQLPVYDVAQQAPGAVASGPLILQESFFTAWVPKGWTFRCEGQGDLLLTHA